MFKTRVYGLMRRLQGLPCPTCVTLPHIEWREAEAADCESADDGAPAVCERCGRPLPVTFVEICRV